MSIRVGGVSDNPYEVDVTVGAFWARWPRLRVGAAEGSRDDDRAGLNYFRPSRAPKHGIRSNQTLGSISTSAHNVRASSVVTSRLSVMRMQRDAPRLCFSIGGDAGPTSLAVTPTSVAR